MIREQRNREKLRAYYQKFISTNVIDPNVHPWVADSWRQSRDSHVDPRKMWLNNRLSPEKLKSYQAKHNEAITYLGDLNESIREFFQSYNLSLLLIDAECNVLKSYSSPFYQKISGEVEGAKVSLRDIGTSSVSIVQEHQTPFMLFGPEMWIEECQMGEACSAPIMLDGELAYIVTIVSSEETELPHTAMLSVLLTIKYSLEKHLSGLLRLQAQQVILDATPFAVYHVMPGGEIAYANKLGHSRLEGIGAKSGSQKPTNLRDVVFNYLHTPIHKGFSGVPSYNKEVTWITRTKTYEDITTVVPIKRDTDQVVSSVVAVSMPIEDLRTLVAHAAGYTARYSLSSMVGECNTFITTKDKAARVARNQNHVLIQGESGTGKQRMAHGIHQSSSRAAGPLISVKCGDLTPELMEQELFGVCIGLDNSHPGKLELANGGTLFMDEIEKLPRNLQLALSRALKEKVMRRVGEAVERQIDVRIISACDSDLKRLTERSCFDAGLYEIISKSVIRMPSLRSRREDIPLLANHIVGELATQHQMPRKRVLPETAELLKNYDWPGNIKQLQGVMEYAFFNTAGNEIHPDEINLMGDIKADNTWKEDKEVFVKAWNAAGGNVSRLSNLLNVSRVTLYRYMKKYGIEKM